MNAGLGNLRTLKSFLLAPALVDSTDYDAALLAIGRGVAGQFERTTNRKLGRVVDDTHTFGVDREHIFLPRSPVEAITKIELKDDPDTGFVEQTLAGFFTATNHAAGFAAWSGELGEWGAQVRFTYTAGYWFETLEPADESYPSTLPEGATALPEDLQLAWLLQCENVWKIHDKLGTSITGGGDGGVTLLGLSLPGLDLIPQVLRALRPYVRATLT